MRSRLLADPITRGWAVVTTAGKLHSKAVIHAPTMEEPGMKIGVENVRRATRAAMLAAARYNHATIAFPRPAGMSAAAAGSLHAELERAIVGSVAIVPERSGDHPPAEPR